MTDAPFSHSVHHLADLTKEVQSQVGTFKSGHGCLSGNSGCTVKVKREVLVQVERFKDLNVLFTSIENSRWTGAMTKPVSAGRQVTSTQWLVKEQNISDI